MPLGIPHSFFLGGEHRWTQDDRDKVFAHQILDHERCPQCRQFPDDWQDPETKRPIYPAPLDVVHWYCECCKQIDDARDNMPERKQGVSVRLVTPKPVDDNEPMI